MRQTIELRRYNSHYYTMFAYTPTPKGVKGVSLLCENHLTEFIDIPRKAPRLTLVLSDKPVNKNSYWFEFRRGRLWVHYEGSWQMVLTTVECDEWVKWKGLYNRRLYATFYYPVEA